MEERRRLSDKDRLLLDLYQEKIRYILEDRLVDEAWDWQTTLGKMNFRPPLEEGIPEPDLEAVFTRAENLLRRKPAFDIEYPDIMLMIHKLGKKPGKQDAIRDRSLNAAAALEMGRIFAAHPESDILLRAESFRTETGETKTGFAVGSVSLSEAALAGMIRSVYGRVEYERTTYSERRYPITCHASAEMIVRNKQELEQRFHEKELKSESWISTVLNSLAGSRCFCVEFRFHPLLGEEEKAELERLGAELEEVYTELAFYSEVGWNSSASGGGNVTLKNSALHNLAKNMHLIQNTVRDGIQSSENYTFTYGKSSKVCDRRAAGLAAEIEYQLLRIRQIQSSVGWMAAVSVSAADEETVEAVTSIISGAALGANMSFNWRRFPCAAILASPHDIFPLMMFPTKEFGGFEFVENEAFSLISPEGPDKGIYVGNILCNGTEISRFYLPGQVLNRHAFICGMTGAGKTNTLFKIMEEIQVPFLVIEPVKGEYRSLLGKYGDMDIWTMRVSGTGEGNVRILQLNPFWFPKGSSLAFHIDSIKTIISSAFDLSAAMPDIVEQCLYNIYVKCGWNIISNCNIYQDILSEEYLYPTFSDLTNEVADYLDRSDFGEEVLGNYKGALLSRLKSFTNGAKGALLNVRKHPDYARIMEGRSMIELEGLADDADKCLVMGTVLVQYYQYLKGHFSDTDKENSLKHIIVIEEAHRLFKNVRPQNKGTEGADPVGQLVESLGNIMAEIRAFGEGMLIVDQSPGKVAEDVVKNSGTKLVHRIDNECDMKVLQSAMLMKEDFTGFSSLAQGEALIRTDGMLRPCKVKILCSHIKEAYSLASSFQVEDVPDVEINDRFEANTILQNEFIYREIKEQVNMFFRSMVWMDWKNWYEVVNRFVLEIIWILRNHDVLDRAQGRLRVLIEIISAAVLKMFHQAGTKNAGLVHMFTMRVMGFYVEAGEGIRVRQGAVEMLRCFFRDRLCDQVFYGEKLERMEDSGCQQFAEALGSADRPGRASMLYAYVCSAADSLKEGETLSDMGKAVSIAGFLRQNTYLSEEDYRESYKESEARLQEILGRYKKEQ